MPGRYLYLGLSHPAIPIVARLRPRQCMVLHWALKDATKEGAPRVQDAVCLDRTALYEEFLRSLLEALAEQHSPIYVYTDRERASLVVLAKQFPHLRELVWPVCKRIRVLSSIIKQHYYAPGIDMTFSLTSVSRAVQVSRAESEVPLHDDLAMAPLRKAFLLDTPTTDWNAIRHAMKAYAVERLRVLEAVHGDLTRRAGQSSRNNGEAAR